MTSLNLKQRLEEQLKYYRECRNTWGEEAADAREKGDEQARKDCMERADYFQQKIMELV